MQEQDEDLVSSIEELLNLRKFSTPCLLIDKNTVHTALDLFKTYLPKVKLFYAVKTNPNRDLIKYFASCGLSFEASSDGEISTLASLGIEGERILLGSAIKTMPTIRSMCEQRVSHCAVDSIGELNRIAEYYDAMKVSKSSIGIFVRFRTESSNVDVDLNTKFGCSPAHAIELVARIKEVGFHFSGLSFHVGSQSLDADNHVRGIETAMQIAEITSTQLNTQVPIINIGGGFCDPMRASEAGVSVHDYYRTIGHACEKAISSGFEIFAEPGRSLVSAAGYSVSSVIGVSNRNNQNWAYLDDGIYGCFSLKTYENPTFRFIVVDSKSKKCGMRVPQDKWVLAGPTCDSLDIISTGYSFNTNLDYGDVLICPNMGAYTISTASTFNGMKLPDCHLVELSEKSNSNNASLTESENPTNKIDTIALSLSEFSK